MTRLTGRVGALRAERGFTLTELLVSMTLMLVVLFAVLTVFDAFTSNAIESERRSESQDQARYSTDRLAKELRNLASPALSGDSIERVGPYDLIFRTVDREGPNTGANAANVRRVRYCLPSNGKWQKQWQTWTTATPPAAPIGTDCPASGWTGTQSLVRLENQNSGGRPLFQYDSSIPSAISSVRTDVFVKGKQEAEVRLSTAVGLRNQNRGPTASFTATPSGSRLVLLNGSASLDPDGQELEYLWYANGGTQPVARGPIVQWTAPTTGTHTLKLKVVDPGELFSEAASQTVIVS